MKHASSRPYLVALALAWAAGCGSNKTDHWPVEEPVETRTWPRPTTENEPQPVTKCNEQGVCIQYVTLGSRSDAWSIGVDHMTLISNTCTVQGWCITGWSPAWHEACLKRTVDDLCNRVDCNQPIEKGQQWNCISQIRASSCVELERNRDTFLTCKGVPPPDCEMRSRSRHDRLPEQICKGVGETLSLCNRSKVQSSCPYQAQEAEQCMAVERTEDEWNAIADCVDGPCDPETGLCEIVSCKSQLECLRGFGIE